VLPATATKRSYSLQAFAVFILFLLCPLELIASPIDGTPEPHQHIASYPNVDLHCGARCVRAILEHYGKNEELRSLIDEIEGDRRMGASLADIQAALQRRGIFTRALKMSRYSDLNWPYPAVIHLKGDNEVLGHFVVQVASAPNLIWLGLVGEKRFSSARLRSLRSGYVLLTSDHEINDVDRAVSVAWTSPLVLFVTFVGASVPLFAVALTIGLKRSRRSVSHICQNTASYGGT
jgi:ABC-type bacteriocin/lantibiotic exporter with double-glycine peptidase domain